MLFKGYELEYILLGFFETLKVLQRLDSSILCHSTHPNILRHKSKTRPRSPDTFLSGKLIFKSLYLKNGSVLEASTLKFEISTLNLMNCITKNFRVICTLRIYFLTSATYIYSTVRQMRYSKHSAVPLVKKSVPQCNEKICTRNLPNFS